jgi:hypothetical protein
MFYHRWIAYGLTFLHAVKKKFPDRISLIPDNLKVFFVFKTYLTWLILL